MSITYTIECDRCGDEDSIGQDDLHGSDTAMGYWEMDGWTEDADDDAVHICPGCNAEARRPAVTPADDAADQYPSLQCPNCKAIFSDVRIQSNAGYPFECPICTAVVLATADPRQMRKAAL